MINSLLQGAVHKGRPHKIAKIDPSPLVRKTSALAQPHMSALAQLRPLVLADTINFEKIRCGLHQKLWMTASEEPPPHWTTRLNADVFYGQLQILRSLLITAHDLAPEFADFKKKLFESLF